MGGEFVTDVSPECRKFLLDVFSGREELFGAFLEKMKLLQGFLYETNEKFNLTALPPRAFWSKHVADSLFWILFICYLNCLLSKQFCVIAPA